MSKPKQLATEWNNDTMPILFSQLFRKEYDAMESKMSELNDKGRVIVIGHLAFYIKPLIKDLLKYLNVQEIYDGLGIIVEYMLGGSEARIKGNDVMDMNKYLPKTLSNENKQILLDNRITDNKKGDSSYKGEINILESVKKSYKPTSKPTVELEDSLYGVQLKQLTVVQLKDYMRANNIRPLTGKKDELIRRLQHHGILPSTAKTSPSILPISPLDLQYSTQTIEPIKLKPYVRPTLKYIKPPKQIKMKLNILENAPLVQLKKMIRELNLGSITGSRHELLARINHRLDFSDKTDDEYLEMVSKGELPKIPPSQIKKNIKKIYKQPKPTRAELEDPLSILSPKTRTKAEKVLSKIVIRPEDVLPFTSKQVKDFNKKQAPKTPKTPKPKTPAFFERIDYSNTPRDYQDVSPERELEINRILESRADKDYIEYKKYLSKLMAFRGIRMSFNDISPEDIYNWTINEEKRKRGII